ncbi:MAG: hypothetical protein HY284_02170 [Nitrospirae bacterium]|nr:hypothetical protein [Nitrospirota bacterium]
MDGKSYGQMMGEQFVRAIPWAVVFSVAVLITTNGVMGMLKQDVREAIEYTFKTAVHQSVHTIANDPEFNNVLWPKVKQNTKEAIEYTITMAERRKLAATSAGKGEKKK